MKFLIIIVGLLVINLNILGDVIQSSNRIDWIKDHTVGVRGGIPNDDGWTQVLVPPTNTVGLNAALAAATGPTIFILTNGVYDITSTWSLTRSYSRFRGVGTNTLLWGYLVVGADSSGVNTFSITNGGAKGSTNFILDSITDFWGDNIAPGDSLLVFNGQIITNDVFPVISVAGYRELISQPVSVFAVSGKTITTTAPLVYGFTNGFVRALNDLQGATNVYQPFQIGFENLKFSTNNAGTPAGGSSAYMLQILSLVNSWFTNVYFQDGPNYQIGLEEALHVEMVDCWVGPARGSGTSHSGLLLSKIGASLFQNTIFDGIPQVSLMFNEGVSGNAFFGLFFTNNPVGYAGNGDILCHNTHPMMNLWEANFIPIKFIMDGYFGSASHQTLFRNWHWGSISFKRWITYMQVVGNVFGVTNGYEFVSLYNEDPTFTDYPIFELGRPHIGNIGYDAISPDQVPHNWPGTFVSAFTPEEGVAGYSNGVFVFNADYGPTNRIHPDMGTGTLTNIPPQIGVGYALIMQSAGNTNIYHNGLTNNSALVSGPGWDGTQVWLTNNVIANGMLWATFKSGDRLYIAGQNAYPWLQRTNKHTHNLHGNLVYTNNLPGVVWDPLNADHNISNSLLYASAPGWWGTNRWPAYGPDVSPYVAYIPAQLKYYGIDSGGGGGGGNPALPITNTVTQGKVEINGKVTIQ